MNEAEILASTYDDTMSVYRPFKDTLPSGESVFKKGMKGKQIYVDIACALSSHSGGKANTSDTAVTVDSDYKLFYAPSIKIEKNDTIVCLHQGIRYLLQAGRAFVLSSHCELPVNEISDTA